MQRLLDEAKNKQRSLVTVFKGVDAAGQRLSTALHKAQQDVNDTVGLLVQIIDEQRQRALRDLENAYGSKQVCHNFLFNNNIRLNIELDRLNMPDSFWRIKKHSFFEHCIDVFLEF